MNTKETVMVEVEHEIEFEIGGYSNLLQAEQEAREFARDTVFTRRSEIFPNPIAFGLTIASVSSKAHQWPDPPVPMNQFYIHLKISVFGDPKKVKDWERKVCAQIKIMHPSYIRHPETMGERAAHLRERGLDKAETTESKDIDA